MTTSELQHCANVQRQMIADLNLTREGGRLGASHPCGRDPDTGEPLTLGMMFDRYAVCLAVFTHPRDSASEDER